MKVKVEGMTSLSGRPETIISLMQAAWFGGSQNTTDEHILTIQNTVWRGFGIGLQAEGKTTEERANSLLHDMEKHGLLKIEEEE